MYLALDIETTGRNKEICQVLQIGAVMFDFLPEGIRIYGEFLANISHKVIVGEAYALAMNAEILRQYSENASVVEEKFYDFISRCNDGITVVGKNAAGFDIPFLEKCFGKHLPFNHRVLDIGSLLFTPETGMLGLEQCKEKVGLTNTEVKHQALADAKDCIDILSMHFYGEPCYAEA